MILPIGKKGGGRMKLIEPTMAYDREIQAYRQEFLDTGDSMDGAAPCGAMNAPRTG